MSSRVPPIVSNCSKLMLVPLNPDSKVTFCEMTPASVIGLIAAIARMGMDCFMRFIGFSPLVCGAFVVVLYVSQTARSCGHMWKVLESSGRVNIL